MHIERQIEIQAPPDSVWRCLTEYDLRKRWMAQLESEEPVEPHTTGPGAATIVRLQQNGKSVSYRSTIIDWEPGKKLSVGMTGGQLPPEMAIGVIYEITPGVSNNSTVLDYQFHWPVKGFIWRLLSPLMKRGVGTVIDPDLARLRDLAATLAQDTGGR